MIAFLNQNIWAIWLIVAVLFLILEAVTTTLVSIWFVPSAALVALLSLWVPNVAVQLAVFVVLSAVFMVLFRKLYKRKPNELKESNERLIGKAAIAQSAISPIDGQVLVGDVHWRAISSGEDIPEGTVVTIRSIEGTTLTVSVK